MNFLFLKLLEGTKQWIVISSIAGIICGGYFIQVLSEKEEHSKPNKFPYAHIRTKQFPWGNGEDELFTTIGKSFGLKYGEDEEKEGTHEDSHSH